MIASEAEYIWGFALSIILGIILLIIMGIIRWYGLHKIQKLKEEIEKSRKNEKHLLEIIKNINR